MEIKDMITSQKINYYNLKKRIDIDGDQLDEP